jgi:hypothetical protein
MPNARGHFLIQMKGFGPIKERIVFGLKVDKRLAPEFIVVAGIQHLFIHAAPKTEEDTLVSGQSADLGIISHAALPSRQKYRKIAPAIAGVPQNLSGILRNIKQIPKPGEAPPS